MRLANGWLVFYFTSLYHFFTLHFDPTGCDEAAELGSAHVQDYDGRKRLYVP